MDTISIILMSKRYLSLNLWLSRKEFCVSKRSKIELEEVQEAQTNTYQQLKLEFIPHVDEAQMNALDTQFIGLVG